MSLKWRLGIDLDTNSLGWVALELDEADEGVGKVVSVTELLVALLHLSRRRGFKSNKKIDAEDKDATKRLKQISHLRNFLDQENVRRGIRRYTRNAIDYTSGRRDMATSEKYTFLPTTT